MGWIRLGWLVFGAFNRNLDNALHASVKVDEQITEYKNLKDKG